MTAQARAFAPGELVRARGREWVVLGADDGLRVRPLSGTEAEIEVLQPELEIEPITGATFPAPAADRTGGREAAQLLRDALRLSLRRGAGPFRSAGRLAFEPRAYQLAPLLMALRHETVRLLIADDVGIGKTIEAGMIIREFLDRGEIERFAVLCPPHLVDQWTRELEEKFALSAMAVTASGAARLERDLPDTVSVFDAYPFTVVSLDFIKSDRRRNDFLRACPEMVVIDEAHACVSGGRARHQRFRLLRDLAADREKPKHMIMLTATPHSGDEQAFHNLLGLLDPDFTLIGQAAEAERRRMRERLAGHFIQRRRADIADWREPDLFPARETSDLAYRLSGGHERLFNDVLAYCADVVDAADGDRRRRLAFWGTLALMRCVGSSPAAAARALRTRAVIDINGEEEAAMAARALDDEEAAEDDVEPGAAIDDPRLAGLIAMADRLADDPRRDPKYACLLKAVQGLIAGGFRPVVFCRFIATAEAVGASLARDLDDVQVATVTGDLPSDEREARVETLAEAADRRVLVATDCLSEGVNLQAWFDAVVHYDLSWNPTRHQQREGRIDRFGQPSKLVRTVLIYGENNPVDGAVLDVILRKARRIEQETGVRVPLPDQDGSLTQALMSKVLLHARARGQLTLDLQMPEARAFDVAWTNASEKEKRSRTVFAQRTLKPEEVAPEWDATRLALGGAEDTERFVTRALIRLGRAPQRLSDGTWRASLAVNSPMLRERLIAEGLVEDVAEPPPVRLAFGPKAPARATALHRTHPLPGVLAETFLEEALEAGEEKGDPAVLPRIGAWESAGVERVTHLFVLRLRHRLDSRGRLGAPRFQMAEEAAAVALSKSGTPIAQGPGAFALLDADSADLAEAVKAREIAAALDTLPARMNALNAFAAERAACLAEDHSRVRRVLGSQAQVSVTGVEPVDVIGLYVLLPRL
ncbi:DEAD/DEAH box helicase [Accumulibacter sp.]|uniref:DEAD/DEAH box helicase n=1 Tax=Accumulibacter sp. TaxID=2053492 RepID=UPI0025D8BE16|nr:DEAD/DEAH box helicase [Accumulibacter sp.]MCM8625601.1 DEAD/DEAH box helicase [Accumulibacter sp.]